MYIIYNQLLQFLAAIDITCMQNSKTLLQMLRLKKLQEKILRRTL